MVDTDHRPQGQNNIWIGDQSLVKQGAPAFGEALGRLGNPLFIVRKNGEPAVTHNGTMLWGQNAPSQQALPLLGFVPALRPADLGDSSFKTDLGLKYAYVVGAMANGITSVEMVEAAGRAGMVGFFGAGGLTIEQIETAIHRLRNARGAYPFGFNLIHSPNDPALEMTTVERYLQNQVRLISASAFLGLTLPLVYYRVKGIHTSPDGSVICPNRVVAKVSRMEVAAKFFAPPPDNLLCELVQQGKISEQEARLSRHIPMAQDISAEADSGGHTDNRPALTMMPTFAAIRDAAAKRYGFPMPLRVGLGGGIATPEAVCAAFAMGAAYVLTGSINQAAVEADTSRTVKEMLAQTRQADVTMAPAADMFELGAKVQVLKRGTMFAMRGGKLYDLYRSYESYEQIPQAARTAIERDMLRSTFEEAWRSTRQYFLSRDPGQIERADKDPQHKMALVFRSYLGQASLWAKTGLEDRKIDYQIWCGPAMGAFNAWVGGSFLEPLDNRQTAVMGMNLVYGAARLMRCQWLKCQGVALPADAEHFTPLPLEQIQSYVTSGFC